MTAKTALVVDDSKSARFALRRFLEGHGYRVTTAEGAEEAYGVLREQDLPDVLFLDHIMPGVEGFEALERITGEPRSAGVPVIICSSHDNTEFVRNARAAGAAGVLAKPPSAAQLKQILENLPPRPAVGAPPPSKVAIIREPEVAIHQRVMKVLRSTLGSHHDDTHEHDSAHAHPAPARAPEAQPPQAPRVAADTTALRQVQQDLLTQIAELREENTQLRELLEQQAEQIAQLRQPGADGGELTAAVAALQTRLAELETAVEERHSELHAALETGLHTQSKRIAQVTESARAAAQSEAHSEAERTVMSAASRISDQLAQSILNALRSITFNPLAPRSAAESVPDKDDRRKA